MMSRIDRTRRVVPTQRAASSDDAPVDEVIAPTGSTLPVAVAPAARTFKDDRRRYDSELTAHMIGQAGERRGLRAGPALIDRAHVSYNRTEWSGPYDRRARKGGQTRTDI